MVGSRREREKQREKNQTAQGREFVCSGLCWAELNSGYRILGRLTRLSAVKKTLFDEGPG